MTETLQLRECVGTDGFGFWSVVDGSVDAFREPLFAEWLQTADAMFASRAEIASLSVVRRSSSLLTNTAPAAPAALAGAAALPVCFLNGRVAGLLGEPGANERPFDIVSLRRWVERATHKGLVHVWLLVEHFPAPLRGATVQAVPAPRGGIPALTAPWRSAPGVATSTPPIALGIDAAWLLGGESGAQVFVFEMVRALSNRDDIARIVLLSDSGGVPRSLAGVAKVSGAKWADVVAGRVDRLDVMHRPYQPGADVDYRRYHAAARCVAITVLDFIAYDNPGYHDSIESWQAYRQLFDRQIGLADGVFAISDYIGARLQSQFAHQLAGPVRTVLLGTDHLSAAAPRSQPTPHGPFGALEPGRFLLVLGNDFDHKNRDFAVRVFVDMCERGYEGSLVLAGFHLDAGSTYGHELATADAVSNRIVRAGSVSTEDKTWLLHHAEAVLYPTSSEGFGLIPFEAAALGTPTAFVSFGPLRQTLAGVTACGAWQTRLFADHVFALLREPLSQLEQIRRAAAALTWRRCADEMALGYHQLLSDAAPWQTRRVVMTEPRRWQRISGLAESYTHRARRKLRRIAADTWTGRKS